MDIKDYVKKYQDESDDGKRLWLAGAEFGRNATARMSRKVPPTEVEVAYVKSNYRWSEDMERKFCKISKKTGNKLSSEVSLRDQYWGSPIKLFDTEEEAKEYWESLMQNLAIDALREASQVAAVYLASFDEYNKQAGKYKMNREDALAIMKI